MGVGIHRYSSVAAFWHWLSAALVLTQFYTGYMFHQVFERGTPERTDMFAWHKTFGVLLLVVAILRVATRFFKPAPPIPQQLEAWERVGAKVSHLLLYGFILLIPLGGLVAISDRGPVELKGGITIPALPGVTEPIADFAGDAHETYVWWFAALLGVHLVAGLYHQSKRTAAAGRMWPFKGPANR
ncbi:cytochrome b [Sphingomicrobium sediminis]|uniref:Cytochrome b n=1 Tax=Sphingomicrobium sediminis TaxID=2950949 RepID=A0A9X2EH49_9SPHN|nr:cytochrome b [Sphingomicrobium sediminis]MCM8557450.1 cytochrome b [Sphingomicrobium sediminis]